LWSRCCFGVGHGSDSGYSACYTERGGYFGLVGRLGLFLLPLTRPGDGGTHGAKVAVVRMEISRSLTPPKVTDYRRKIVPRAKEM